MKLSLTFRLWVAYQALFHGRYLVDRPFNVQIMVPRDCLFTDEEIRKVCGGVHAEIMRAVDDADAGDA